MDRVKKNIVGVESAKRELISKRYKRITKAVNSEFLEFQQRDGTFTVCWFLWAWYRNNR